MKQLLIAALFLLVFTLGCTSGAKDNNQTQSTGEVELIFSISKCGSDIDPYTEPSSGILSQDWKDGALVIQSFVKANCGGANITGDYELAEKNLNLFYTVKTGSIVTSCNCAHLLTYEMKGLNQGDYAVTLTSK